ncbi:MAG: class II aldolase/adducin family protein [Zoogloea sp.]|nr:class II aldolase/adducin family protein [Zoogloea sp.]
MNENVLRAGLLATARSMATSGLNAGTAGNASVRCARCFLITPSGRSYDDCTDRDMALVAMDGSWQGPHAPSSEWRIHRDILAAHPEAGAVLHAHSPFATALACLRRGIPAFHYMIARFGGDDIRCAPYATFGTQALSDAALTALEGRNACLLANHGMLVFGSAPGPPTASPLPRAGLKPDHVRASQHSVLAPFLHAACRISLSVTFAACLIAFGLAATS